MCAAPFEPPSDRGDTTHPHPGSHRARVARAHLRERAPTDFWHPPDPTTLSGPLFLIETPGPIILSGGRPAHGIRFQFPTSG